MYSQPNAFAFPRLSRVLPELYPIFNVNVKRVHALTCLYAPLTSRRFMLAHVNTWARSPGQICRRGLEPSGPFLCGAITRV